MEASWYVYTVPLIFKTKTNVLQHDVITTICDYIDIWCLTIKHPHVEEAQATAREGVAVAKKAQ